MSLSLDDVNRIAHLARIEITPAEAERSRGQLNDILAFVEQLQAVDATGVTPMAHAVDMTLRLRDDVVSEGDRRDDFLALAPQTEAGLYLVPKVIEA